MRTALRAERPERIGIAVSGGGDSLALLHLMAALAPDEGWHLQVATVDHALRPGSAAEARQVGALCAGLGLAHAVLCWDHGPVRGNLQDAARQARYDLLAGWALAQGLDHVVLAHTRDDQAETFLMGLSRMAGLDGLVGMRPGWSRDGIRFVRPLLAAGRDELRSYLTGLGVGWIDDPSNEDMRFARVRARRVMEGLTPLGLSAGVLDGVMSNLRQAQAALQGITLETAAKIASEPAGMVCFERAAWGALSPELRRRLMIGALMSVSGAAYPPRATALARFLTVAKAGRTATLWGCRLLVTTDGLCIVREPRAVEGLRGRPGQAWDRRWRVEGPFAPGMEIRVLGPVGLIQCPKWRETGLPRAALLVSPAVWHDDRLISAPMVAFCNGFSARIDTAFALRSVLH